MVTAIRKKPAKPTKDFALFAHANGQWCKKIRGDLYYFGPWSDPDAALKKYLDEKDDLQAGRKPRSRRDGGLQLRDMLDEFLVAKRHLVDTSELSIRSFRDYHSTCDRIIEKFGATRIVEDLGADDFVELRAALAETRGPVALGNEIGRIRVVLNYAYDAGLIEKPVRIGPTFRKPSKKTLRRERRKKGPRMFDVDELRRIIDAAGVPMKAMILLGINCGFGPTDVSELPLSAVDLDGGWIDYPRPKTEVERRIPLWPETVKAIHEAIRKRPTPKSEADAGLLFVTKYGSRWTRANEAGMSIDPVGMLFGRLLKTLDINGHRGFYCLRHTLQSIGERSRDFPAVAAIMGHVPKSDDMASVYREEMTDERLRAVVKHVRQWLWSDA